MPVTRPPTSTSCAFTGTRGSSAPSEWGPETFDHPPAGYIHVDSSLTNCGVCSGCGRRRRPRRGCARRDRPGGGARCEAHAQPLRPAGDRRVGPLRERGQHSSPEISASEWRISIHLGSRPARAGGPNGARWSQRVCGAPWRVAVPDARRVAGVSQPVSEARGLVSTTGSCHLYTEGSGAL